MGQGGGGSASAGVGAGAIPYGLDAGKSGVGVEKRGDTSRAGGAAARNATGGMGIKEGQLADELAWKQDWQKRHDIPHANLNKSPWSPGK